MASSPFRYNFKSTDTAELGYMYQIGKKTWPTSDDQRAWTAHADYMEQIFEELLIRWACAADSDDHHIQGQRL